MAQEEQKLWHEYHLQQTVSKYGICESIACSLRSQASSVCSIYKCRLSSSCHLYTDPSKRSSSMAVGGSQRPRTQCSPNFRNITVKTT